MARRRMLRSLRSRVATTVAVFAAIVGLVVASGVTYLLWHNTRSSAEDRAGSLAFDVAEYGPKRIRSFAVRRDEMAFVFTPSGDVAETKNGVDEAVIDAAFESVVLDSVDEEFVALDEADVGSRHWTFAGLTCADEKICDAIITGVATVSLPRYFLSNWYFIVLAGLGGGMCAYFVARWLVGRSLRPIEVMRRELASITATRLDQRVVVPTSADEVEQVGRTLNETLDRLEAAVAANERFVADAAHELRSPLTGVRLALEVEVAKGDQPLLKDALTEIDRAGTLVDDLLVLARRPSRTARRVDVDLDDLLNDELASFRRRFPNVAVTASSAPARVLGDADSLRRVIRNLLDNAAFYGLGRIAVATSNVDETGGEHGNVRLRVDDDGPGIDPEDRVRVFDRFTRLDSSRSRATGGSGLGLAIVKEIVDEHRGTISIGASDLGGARFDVTFPT